MNDTTDRPTLVHVRYWPQQGNRFEFWSPRDLAGVRTMVREVTVATTDIEDALAHLIPGATFTRVLDNGRSFAYRITYQPLTEARDALAEWKAAPLESRDDERIAAALESVLGFVAKAS
jgi:hypothetical protein